MPKNTELSFPVNSGNYTVRIRGREVDVHCRMEATPAETFIDLYALSEWAGSKYGDKPLTKKQTAYSKALILYDLCLLVMDRSNTQFRTAEVHPTIVKTMCKCTSFVYTFSHWYKILGSSIEGN